MIVFPGVGTRYWREKETDSYLFGDFRWSQNQSQQKSVFLKHFKMLPNLPPPLKKGTKELFEAFWYIFAQVINHRCCGEWVTCAVSSGARNFCKETL